MFLARPLANRSIGFGKVDLPVDFILGSLQMHNFSRNLIELPGQPEQRRQARIQIHHHEYKTDNHNDQKGLLEIELRPGCAHINNLTAIKPASQGFQVR